MGSLSCDRYEQYVRNAYLQAAGPGHCLVRFPGGGLAEHLLARSIETLPDVQSFELGRKQTKKGNWVWA